MLLKTTEISFASRKCFMLCWVETKQLKMYNRGKRLCVYVCELKLST